MKAILLAAGLGTRLKPITDYIPKCMVPIHGFPLLMWWVEMLKSSGVNDILINLHWHPDFVQRAFASSPYKDQVQFVFEENLLGTGGTLLKNSNFWSVDDIIVAHADNLSQFSVSDFVKKHVNRPALCEITMMTFEAPDPQSCGIVELNKSGMVTAFHEKVKNPPGSLANGAVYIFSKEVLRFLEKLSHNKSGSNPPFIDLSLEVIPNFMGRIQTFNNDLFHRDIGTFEGYTQATQNFHFSKQPKWIPDLGWWSDLLGADTFSSLRPQLSLARS